MHGSGLPWHGLFDDAVSVHIGAEIYATLSCTRKDSGQFMASEEEGAQDYPYIENWEGSLLFPYVFEADQPDRAVVPPGLWPVTVSVRSIGGLNGIFPWC